MIAGKLAKTDLDNGRIDLDPIAGATLGVTLPFSRSSRKLHLRSSIKTKIALASKYRI